MKLLDFLSSLWEANDEQTASLLSDGIVAAFLLCGECVILGAALFSGLVASTPDVSLTVSSQASRASLLAVLSAVGYHVVCLSWYADRLGLLHVAWLAPLFQTLHTVAIALLYVAVVDTHGLTTASRHPRTARFC